MQYKLHTRLTFLILLAMCLGVIAGTVFGPRIVAIGFLGATFIQIIKVVAVPLVFVSILDAVVATDLSWKTARRWLGVIAINTSCALAIGLILSNILEPGRAFTAFEPNNESVVGGYHHEISFESFVGSIIPESIVEPFVKNNILGVVLLALLLGAATRSYLSRKASNDMRGVICKTTEVANGILTQLILWLVMLVPIAVFCVTAKTVGQHGFSPFRGLFQYVGVVMLGFVIHVSVVYSMWILRVAEIPLRKFLNVAHKPVVYAFGTNSSLATLPVTLSALDSLGIKKAASRLGACVGTNFNNDGILLYEAAAVLFVAQACGIELSLSEQLTAAFISLTAAIGVAGIPEAGVVSLSLVLTAVGLPVEIIPLLLTVDWFVARLRSVVNVLSDMTVSIAVSRFL